MRPWCSGLVALAIGLSVFAVPALAQPRQVRLGLVAGNNLGHDAARGLHFAEDEVGRLAELLKSAGDFEDVITLRGASRGDIEKGLLQIRQKLQAAKPRAIRRYFSSTILGTGTTKRSKLAPSACCCATCGRTLNSSLPRMSAWPSSTRASRAR